MITKTHLARSTVPAIAAALVLGSTPLAAQDPAAPPRGQPSVVAAPPTVAPAPLPTPRMQLPVDPAPVTSAPPAAPMTSGPASSTSSNPVTTGAAPVRTTTNTPPTSNRVFDARTVVQQVPATQEGAAAPATAERAPAPRADAAARTSAATPPPEPSIPEIPEPAPPGDIPPPLPPVPPVIDQSVDANASIDSASQDSGTDTAVWLGLLASGLGILGLGFLGALALRRRQVRRVDRVPVIERPKVDPAPVPPVLARTSSDVAPLAIPAGTATIAGIADASASAPRDAAPHYQGLVLQIREPARERSPNLAPAGATVALPRTIPATYDEREALLQRMVAAKPDRANPFHSPRARRHRARLIMQSLGRTFANGKSRIDLSQYPQNWPELQHNRPAAA